MRSHRPRLRSRSSACAHFRQGSPLARRFLTMVTCMSSLAPAGECREALPPFHGRASSVLADLFGEYASTVVLVWVPAGCEGRGRGRRGRGAFRVEPRYTGSPWFMSDAEKEGVSEDLDAGWDDEELPPAKP